MWRSEGLLFQHSHTLSNPFYFKFCDMKADYTHLRCSFPPGVTSAISLETQWQVISYLALLKCWQNTILAGQTKLCFVQALSYDGTQTRAHFNCEMLAVGVGKDNEGEGSHLWGALAGFFENTESLCEVFQLKWLRSQTWEFYFLLSALKIKSGYWWHHGFRSSVNESQQSCFVCRFDI